jgi:hypothetical protein
MRDAHNRSPGTRLGHDQRTLEEDRDRHAILGLRIEADQPRAHRPAAAPPGTTNSGGAVYAE